MTVHFTSPDEWISVGCQPPGLESTRLTVWRLGMWSGFVALVTDLLDSRICGVLRTWPRQMPEMLRQAGSDAERLKSSSAIVRADVSTA